MAWINSSDIYYPWTLQTVAEIFRDVPEAQWIMGMPTLLDSGRWPKVAYVSEGNVYDFLAEATSHVQQESVFWRRGLWEQAGGRLDPSIHYACDYALWLRFLELAPLYHVRTPLAGFRRHEERRGTVGGAYEQEVRTEWLRWVQAAPSRERMRGRLVSVATGRLGRQWRRALAGMPVPRWYRYQHIEYDFELHRWIVS